MAKEFQEINIDTDEEVLVLDSDLEKSDLSDLKERHMFITHCSMSPTNS